MRRMPGPGPARHVLAAAVIGAAAVTAGCGAQHAGQGATGTQAAAAQPSASQCSATPAANADHTVTLGSKDNGKVLCVRQGATVGIFLQGTPTRRWEPIRTTSPALVPAANGRLMLKLGVTGAYFRAVHPGVATVVSSLPSCESQHGGTFPSTGPRCRMGTVFHLKLVVTQ